MVFAIHTRSVFMDEGAEVKFAGEEQLGGRRIAKFTYRVPFERSHYAVRTGEKTEIVAYRGYFEADTATFAPIEL